MGNVMLLKPFETSLSIVYKVKGEVKVKRDGKSRAQIPNKKGGAGLTTHCKNKGGLYPPKKACTRVVI